jgi:amino acid transporter
VAAEGVLGSAGATLVTLGALVSIGGILNGWLLVTGRLSFAAARQGLAPALLRRLHPRFHTPAVSLVLSSLISSVLALLYFNRTLLQAYNLIALASTATALLAIAAVCLAHLRLRRREPARFTLAQRRRGRWVAIVGLLVVLLMIAGTGLQVLLSTLLVAALPLPYYLRLRSRQAVVGSSP